MDRGLVKRKEIESYVGSVDDNRWVRELKKGMNGYVYVKGRVKSSVRRCQ
jgi:hypothetical protein